MQVALKKFEEENVPYMRIVEKKFESFTRPQQIKHLEVEGYLVIDYSFSFLGNNA